MASLNDIPTQGELSLALKSETIQYSEMKTTGIVRRIHERTVHREVNSIENRRLLIAADGGSV